MVCLCSPVVLISTTKHTCPKERTPVRRFQWPKMSKLLLALTTILGIGWGLYGLGRPLQGATFEPLESKATPTATPAFLSAHRTAKPAGELPRAWDTPTRVPTRTAMPTPSPTATPTVRPSVPTYTPLPAQSIKSPTATATLPTTPTPTPIHFPAGRDPTYIAVPAIDLEAKVVTVGIVEKDENGVLKKEWEVADYAAGFHQGMARPGHVGNTVISGHNNIRGEVFRDLHKLKPGDDVYVWVGNSPYRYGVSIVYRLPVKGAPPSIQRDNASWILPTNDQRLTLVTCWPYWSNTHRIVVVAYPVPWDS